MDILHSQKSVLPQQHQHKVLQTSSNTARCSLLDCRDHLAPLRIEGERAAAPRDFVFSATIVDGDELLAPSPRFSPGVPHGKGGTTKPHHCLMCTAGPPRVLSLLTDRSSTIIVLAGITSPPTHRKSSPGGATNVRCAHRITRQSSTRICIP